ncbi:uncharacterized protein N7469_011109 [Penicillium citrinum]|uniref:PWWP domain-containing protein n=1 Tax=Penicillium citrinum TaxID=5077 RepID=A0A9W9NCV8_PENCI|nr:uncharacterized protein N7469_011109 [Penicillium citrinum]KAJ5217484.1 hypothetical protein N7469_011109 [Penicillium citrinum]
MADDTSVPAPPENTTTELPPQSTDKAPETESATDKPEPASASTSANVTEGKKEAEPEANKTNESGDAKETKGDAETVADAEPASAPEPNGTPAKTKRRQSSGTGTGEKKLNRKKSVTRVTHLNAKPGDYYLARLRSYAPWPAIICDEEILPVSLIESRPVTAAQEDGSYRADYADDGKRAHERTYPVMFFGTNEFAWIPNTALTPLDPAECKNVSEKNKAKSLVSAYKVAAEGHDLAHYKKVLSEHQNALDQEARELEEKEAEKEAAKAEKARAKAEKAEKAEKNKKTNKRKSKADTDVEMEEDDGKKSKTTAKKRKNETDGETEKPAKTPKTATKIKLTTPKASEEKKTPASKGKKATKKSKAASDDEEKASSKEPEKQANPEELKKKKEKEVLFLRHKLQKGFISRDQPPKEDEMSTMSGYFDKLEKHSDLEVSIIRSTKINKVLKMIVKLNSIPRDEEFNFRQRAITILSNWKNVLDSEAPGDGAKATPNGAKDDDAADTPKLETEAEAEEEKEDIKNNEDTPMPDVKADEAEAEEKEKTEEKSEEKVEA